jgi:hypothetical protein
MPPAFTLSQDQTLKFISIIIASGRNPTTTIPQDVRLQPKSLAHPNPNTTSNTKSPIPTATTQSSEQNPNNRTPAAHPTHHHHPPITLTGNTPTTTANKNQDQSPAPQTMAPRSRCLSSRITSRKPDAVLKELPKHRFSSTNLAKT